MKIGLESQDLELPKQIMDSFDQRAECFIDQFKKYFRDPMPDSETTSEDRVFI